MRRIRVNAHGAKQCGIPTWPVLACFGQSVKRAPGAVKGLHGLMLRAILQAPIWWIHSMRFRACSRKQDSAIDGFAEFAASDGMAEHLELQERLLDKGCFGVPTFLVDDEVYFGREHLARVCWHLEGAKGDPPLKPTHGSARRDHGASPSNWYRASCGRSC